MTVSQTAGAGVRDLSCTGIRLEGRSLPPRGADLQLKLEEMRLFGTVAWSTGRECGIAFDSALMQDDVDRLREKAGFPALGDLSVEDRLAMESWLLGVSR